MPLTEVAVKRPVTTMMVFLIIVTLGIAGLRHLPIDLLPDIEFPQLTVAVNYSNVGPEEMEQIVTQRIENAVAGVPGIQRVRSRSAEGNSRVTLDFSRHVNLEEAANDLRTAVDRVRGQLPEDADPPRIYKFDPNNIPIVTLGASSPHMDLQELTLVLEREITKHFEQIPGVGAIDVWGGIRREIHIDLNRDRLNASRLAASDVQTALARANVNLAGGNVGAGINRIYIRSVGEFTNLDEIANTVITSVEGRPIRVRDVAEVSFGYSDLDRVVRINERPMLRIGVSKQTGANTVAVAEAVRDAVLRLNRDRSDVQLFVASDQSLFIQQSIDSVKQSTMWGALLAITVLYLFLRRAASTFIIALAIPISIIATFGLLYFNGLTLNQMSFGGLALGVGMVVDSAVVVLENIVRMREEGKDPTTAALVGTKQVGGAILASTLTTIVIFLPVLFMQTIAGVLFQQLALVIVFALLCSLLGALTLVPMLASKLLHSRHNRQGKPTVAPRSPRFARFEQRYANLLDHALRRKGLVLAITGSALIACAAIIPIIPVELAPRMDADMVDVNLRMAPGTNIAVVNRYAEELAAVVRSKLPERGIKHISSEVRDGNAQLEITLSPDSPIGASALADQLRPEVVGLVPGGDTRVNARSGLWILRRIFGGGGGEDVTIELRGYDMDQAQKVAQQIKLAIESAPGIEGVRLRNQEGRPEERIVFDRTKLAELGLSVRAVAEAIQTNIGGSRAGMFRSGGDEFPITVRLRPDDRQSSQNLDNIPIRLPGGGVIPLSSVVDKQASRGPPAIERINGQRVTFITANLASGVALGRAVELVRERMAEVQIPPGFSVYFGGEVEAQEEAAADFRLSLLIALLLVYMVMAAQFERFLDPLIVLFAVPLALIGVVPTMLLTGTTINMQSLMGIVMLTGIVVNNAIVLVDYINLLRREEGVELHEAVRSACRRRLRPIVITTLTTVLGLAPLSFGIGMGAEMQAALARVVLGGLAASTLITLVFIPVVYLGIHERLAKWNKASAPETTGDYAKA